MYYISEDKAQELVVFTYPMGDRAIRHEPTTGNALVVLDFPVDWEVAYQLRDVFLGELTVVVPYLPNARADHDVPNGARSTARLAAGIGADLLIACDPHSEVWLDEYRDLGLDAIELNIDHVFADFDGYDCVIAPDKGAVNRASHVADLLNVPVVTATKRRDPSTGRLSDYKLDEDLAGKTALVVDDICDGGGTFLLLAEAARGATLDLFVTHGGFTKPDSPLFDAYRTVYTTDSYPGNHDKATVIPVVGHFVSLVN